MQTASLEMVSATLTAERRIRIAKMIQKTITLVLILLINSAHAIAFVCGNDNCDITETYYTCPQDCPSGSADNYCDKVEDGICDPDCKGEEPDCADYEQGVETQIKQDSQSFSLKTIITSISFAFIALAIFILSRKINKQKAESYLEKETKSRPLSGQTPDPFDKYKYIFRK